MHKKILIAVSFAVLAATSVILIYKTICGPADLKTTVPQTSQKELSVKDEEKAIKNFEALIVKSADSPRVEAAYLGLAAIYENRGDLSKARGFYQNAIEKFPGSPNLANTQDLLDNVNVKMLFSPAATKDSVFYEIQKGDTLTKIAKKFGTTVELISKSNNLKDANIRAGKKVKVTKLKFSIVVDKSQNILTLKADGEIFKTYRVATGKNSSTPVGTFKITNKIVDPPWYPPNGGMIKPEDPRNVLGSRWLGISRPSYGIHGTTQPESIGKSVTEGCVRMRNSEVEELYAIVPEGTEVVIID